MLAAATEHARAPAPADQIPLTRNEITHLLTTSRDPSHPMHWSRRRRRHQHRARNCHHKRQLTDDLRT